MQRLRKKLRRPGGQFARLAARIGKDSRLSRMSPVDLPEQVSGLPSRSLRNEAHGGAGRRDEG